MFILHINFICFIPNDFLTFFRFIKLLQNGKIFIIFLLQSDEDLSNFMQVVTKLKNDLVTNKKYEKFTVDSEEAEKWNEWIDAQEQQTYFNNTWLFSECYIYRKLFEGCELT